MSLTIEQRREQAHRKADIILAQFANGKQQQVQPVVYDLLDTIIDDTHELRETKANNSDIRELIIEMREGFKAMDRRFEDMQKHMDKRFEATDRRFEDSQKSVDKRFEDMQKYMDKRFEDMQKYMDRRFEDMQKYMDKRFSQTQWLIGIGFTMITVFMALLRLFPNGIR